MSHLLSWIGQGSVKTELELINSIPIKFRNWSGIGIERFGTKCIELDLKDFELNWN